MANILDATIGRETLIASYKTFGDPSYFEVNKKISNPKYIEKILS